MGSRRQKDTLADMKARDAARKREFEERMKHRESYFAMKKQTSDEEQRPATFDRMAELRRKEVERKKALNEKLKQRAPISTGSSDTCIRPPIKSRVAERQTRKPKIGTLDYKPRGESLADLRRKNLEMKRERDAKIAARTPPYLKARKKETERPTTAGLSRPPQVVCSQRPNTTGRPVMARQSDQSEVSRLKQEVASLKHKIAEMRKQPEPQYTSSQDNLTDSNFENTRNLLEAAYKSFGQIEAMCPNFLNDDVKRAAKVLIGLAAGFVPGSPYHDMYRRAQENRNQPESDQIVLRPGDVDPRATTIVQVVRDNCETESEPGETTVKVVKAKHAPYSRNYSSLADVEEEITIPVSDEDDDEITGELRHILETARPPADWGEFEMKDILGTFPTRREIQREYGHGRPISPLRDFAAEENSLICLDNKVPQPERQKHQKKDRGREELEKRSRRELARLKRDAWQRAAGKRIDEDEYECNESAIEDLIEPQPEDDLCLGPYGEELIKNILPRSRYARKLGLSSEGEGADLCLGDPY